MFDLRYHVASLAAVFLALVIGILVGVAISDPGLADRTSKQALRDQIARLESDLDNASSRLEKQKAAAAFVDAAYPVVMRNRLSTRRIVLVFVGSVDPNLRSAVDETLDDAGASELRLRSLEMPVDPGSLQSALAGRPAFAQYRGKRRLPDLGRALGRELVAGRPTPLWDALTPQLVEERSGRGDKPADGVVLARSVAPQQGDTARFLAGFYEGLGGPVPVVGVEASSASPSAVDTFRRAGFSSVDSIDTATGRVSLAVLLDGGRPGHYGIKDSASRPVPPIEPVSPTATP